MEGGRNGVGVDRHVSVGVVAAERSRRESLRCVIDDLAGVRCGSADERVRELIECPPGGGLDVVVVEVAAPGPDVLEDVTHLRRSFPEARIVLVSGYVDDYLDSRVRAAGADVVLSTDCSLDDVADSIRGDRSPTMAGRGSTRDERASEVAAAYRVTEREFDVLRLAADGRDAQSIARVLGLAVTTVRDHLKSLRRKLDCATTLELVVSAARLGMLPSLSRPLR